MAGTFTSPSHRALWRIQVFAVFAVLFILATICWAIATSDSPAVIVLAVAAQINVVAVAIAAHRERKRHDPQITQHTYSETFVGPENYPFFNDVAVEH